MEVHEFLETKMGADIKSLIALFNGQAIIANSMFKGIVDTMVKKMDDKSREIIYTTLDLKNFYSQPLSMEHMINLTNLTHTNKTTYDGIEIDKKIKLVKRCIKHSKNPLEKRELERQLNKLYKERKRNHGKPKRML